MAGAQPLPDSVSALATEPGFVIWFTGLPAAGKTTLARAVQQALAARQIHPVLLDSDEFLRGDRQGKQRGDQGQRAHP